MPEAAAMLVRPPATATARKARWRDRQRRGVVCPQGVEVSAVELDFLIGHTGCAKRTPPIRPR
jgi:hypothetical protein